MLNNFVRDNKIMLSCNHRMCLMMAHLLCQLLQVSAECPAPFNVTADLCLFVNTPESHGWCSANRQCAAIGGELMNSHGSIKQFLNVSTFGSELWLGMSDFADYRDKSRAGWQRINGRGIFPEDHSLFGIFQPTGGTFGRCIRIIKAVGKLGDKKECNANKRGYVCEYTGAATRSLTATWKATEFKRSMYTSEYCSVDVAQVSSAMKCTAAAMREGNSRHVLYNVRTRICRLMQFTDAQVEEVIEKSADWVKFSIIN